MYHTLDKFLSRCDWMYRQVKVSRCWTRHFSYKKLLMRRLRSDKRVQRLRVARVPNGSFLSDSFSRPGELLPDQAMLCSIRWYLPLIVVKLPTFCRESNNKFLWMFVLVSPFGLPSRPLSTTSTHSAKQQFFPAWRQERAKALSGMKEATSSL